MIEKLSNLKISIVICTHNRDLLLPIVLESLEKQDYPGNNYEIILVDNGSTDDTKLVAQSFAGRLSNLRYVYEPLIGLSSARNRGWREAHGEYVGYLDDDAKAPPNWISVAMDIASRITPEAFGGPYYAFYNCGKPAWFKDAYGSHVQGNEPRSLNSDEYLSGGNLFVRRDLLAELRGFNAALGMAGNKIAYGEETRLIIEIRGKNPGANIYYDPRLFIYHLVSAGKMKLLWAIKSFFMGGRYTYRTLSPDISANALNTIRDVAMIILKLIKSISWDMLHRDRNRYPFYQNYLYENSLMHFYHIGWNMEVLSRILKGKK